MLNKVILICRLTRDPEIKQSNSGTAICEFRGAITRDYKNSNGEYESDFVNVVCFGKAADFVSNWFEKGMLAIVVGRLQCAQWTDNEGKHKETLRVVCESVNFGESKKARAANGHPASAAGGSYAPNVDVDSQPMNIPDGDFMEPASDDTDDPPF